MDQVHLAITRRVKPGMEQAFEDAPDITHQLVEHLLVLRDHLEGEGVAVVRV